MTTWAKLAAERSPALTDRRTRAEEHSTAIIAAARRLAIAKGGQFTIQELAAEAGVGLPTFYRYFRSKDELLVATVGDLVADACAAYALHALGTTDPLERLAEIIAAALATTADPALARFATAQYLRLSQAFPSEMELAARPIVDLILETIREAIDEGQVRTVDARGHAELIADLLIATYHRSAHSSTAEAPDVVARRLTTFVVDGIRGSR